MKRIGSNEFSINEEDPDSISIADSGDYESGVEGASTLQTRKLAREDSITSDTADLLGGSSGKNKSLRERFSQWIDKKMDKYHNILYLITYIRMFFYFIIYS